MEESKKIIYLINYDRTKTLLEQKDNDLTSVDVTAVRDNTQVVIPPIRNKEENNFKFEPPPGCNKNYYIKPSSGSEKNLEYCWYSSLSDGDFENPDRKLIGVSPDFEVEFVGPEIYRNLEKDLIGELISEKQAFNSKGSIDTEYEFSKPLRDDLIFIKGDRNFAHRKSAEYYYTFLDNTERENFWIKQIAPPGSVWSITTKEGVKYQLYFEISGPITKQLPAIGGQIPKRKVWMLTRKGYLNVNNLNDEYEAPRDSDERTDWEIFIDDWGRTIQFGVALAGIAAGVFTGGSTAAWGASIIADLTVAGLLAHRSLEKGDKELAMVELLFGALPLLGTGAKFAGTSSHALSSLGVKLHKAGKLKTEQQVARFWKSLTDDEAKALAIINRQEELLSRQVKKAFNKALNDPNSKVNQKWIRDVLSRADRQEGKKIVLKFWDGSSGRQLKIVGGLIALDAYLQQHSSTKKLSEKTKSDIAKIIEKAFELMAQEDANKVTQKLLSDIIDNADNPDTENKISEMAKEIDGIDPSDSYSNDELFDLFSL